MREKKEINIQIGEQIRLAREEAGLTQEQLAEAVEVSPQYISDAERGVVGVSLATLKKACCALRVPADRLLFGIRTKERGDTLAALCDGLTEEQFALLGDIIAAYIKAVRGK